MILFKIYNTHVKIDGEIPKNLLFKLDEQLSYNHPGYQFMSGGRGGYGLKGSTGGWDGKVRLFQSNKFSIGLLPRVKGIFNEENVEFSVIDYREKIKYGDPLKIDSSKFEIRDYQYGAIKAAKKNESGIIRMATGCHKIGTEILMYDGSVKKVEDVVIGDVLMGPDSKERKVIELRSGEDRMVKIIPDHGQPFVINQDHVLTLADTDLNLVDMKFSDWELLPHNKRREYSLVRVPVDFNNQNDPQFDSYNVGLNISDEIPFEFKTSSREWRLNLLSGIINSNGYVFGKNIIVKIKSDKLTSDIKYLAGSLGFYVNSIKDYDLEYTNLINKIIISGKFSDLKKLNLKINDSERDYLYSKFIFDEDGHDKYYGFLIDNDHRYLLGDFTVTHNSGKTLTIASLVAEYNIPTVIYVIGIELLYQMKTTIESAYGVKCGIVGGGQVELDHDITIMTIWSAASAFDKKIKIDETDFSQETKVSLKDSQKVGIRNKVEKAQLFIFDECQYAASETLQFIHKASVSARHRFLFSGTPWRDTGDDILIEAVGGERIYDLNATKLI